MFRTVVFAFAALPFLAGSAIADCKEDIQAMLASGWDQGSYSIATELSMGGNPFQHTVQYYRDYSHFYQKVKETGVHWLVLGNQEYTSNDGKSWSPSQTRADDWIEKAQTEAARVRNEIKDTECTTEDIDGTTYKKFIHVQEFEEPMKVTSTVTTWVDPESNRPVRRHMLNNAGGQEIEIDTIFDFETEFQLPEP